MSSLSTTPLGAQMTGQMRGPSMVIWLCGASVLVFLLWAAFAWVDEIVRADGQVVSSSRSQSVQNLEGGILADLKTEPNALKPGLIARIAEEMEATTPVAEVPAKQQWRDKQLTALWRHFEEMKHGAK